MTIDKITQWVGVAETDVERAAAVLCEHRGFGFYTDPMEGGQDAYDISMQAMEEVRLVADALIAPVPARAVEVREALTEARVWIEHSFASLRPLSPAACEPGEALLRRIDAALTISAPVEAGGGEALAHAFRHADAEDWAYLFQTIGGGGRSRFWRAVFSEAKEALAAPRTAPAGALKK